jgi:hypothetical protein
VNDNKYSRLLDSGFYLRIDDVRISLCDDPERIALDRDGEGGEFSMREFLDMLRQFISERHDD